VYNFENGRAHFVVSELGTPVAWRPDSQGLLYIAINFIDWEVEEDEHGDEEHRHANMTNHLFYFDLATAQSTQVSPQAVIDDSVPAWSPDGQLVAFGRRHVRTNASRQVWLLHFAEQEIAPLTDDPMLNTGPPQWSADGRFLLFQRFNQQLPTAAPSIWLLEIATGQLTELISPGYMPTFR
jgi:Tol biopolymer transport system component